MLGMALVIVRLGVLFIAFIAFMAFMAIVVVADKARYDAWLGAVVPLFATILNGGHRQRHCY